MMPTDNITIEDYDAFSDEVKHKNRTFLSENSTSFLERLKHNILFNSVLKKEKGDILYRSRKCESKNTAINRDGMKPIRNLGSEGRLNAFNINMLYLSDNKKIAISESRAGLQEDITVATFELKNDIKLVDLRGNNNIGDWSDYLGFNETLRKIGQKFSVPISIDEIKKEYIPTQVIAEFFKSIGYDGVIYNSQFNVSENKEHYNYVLFDIEIAEAIGFEICRIKKIEIEIESATEYSPY